MTFSIRRSLLAVVTAVSLVLLPVSKSRADVDPTSGLLIGIGAGVVGLYAAKVFCESVLLPGGRALRLAGEKLKVGAERLQTATAAAARARPMPALAERLAEEIRQWTGEAGIGLELRAVPQLYARGQMGSHELGSQVKGMARSLGGSVAVAHAANLIALREYEPEAFLESLHEEKARGARLYDTGWPIAIKALDTDRGGEFSSDFNPRVLVDYQRLGGVDAADGNGLQAVDALFVGFGSYSPLPLLIGERIVAVSDEGIAEALAGIRRAFAAKGFAAGVEARERRISSFTHGRFVQGSSETIALQVRGATSDREYIQANLTMLEVVAATVKKRQEDGYHTREQLEKWAKEKAEREARPRAGGIII